MDADSIRKGKEPKSDEEFEPPQVTNDQIMKGLFSRSSNSPPLNTQQPFKGEPHLSQNSSSPQNEKSLADRIAEGQKRRAEGFNKARQVSAEIGNGFGLMDLLLRSATVKYAGILLGGAAVFMASFFGYRWLFPGKKTIEYAEEQGESTTQ